MLPDILTTALEIIIVLDICGAIAYFVISGLVRSRKARAEGEASSPQGSRIQSWTTGGISGPSPQLAYSPGEFSAVYAAAPPEPEKGFSLTAGLKRRLGSLKDRFTYRPAPGNRGVETEELSGEQRKLGRILDSFKEES